MTPKQDTILIVTEQLDSHADAVIDQLEHRGCGVFRLNTETLLSDYSFEWQPSSGLWLRDAVGRELNQTMIRAAYFRKPKRVRPRRAISDPGIVKHIESESQWFLRSLYSLPILWVNNFWANLRGQTKLAQLDMAREIGLNVPDTIVTNVPDQVKAFVDQHGDILCKTFLNSGFKIAGEYESIFAHKLSTAEIERESNRVQNAPVILQEYVEKAYEVRLNVIGKQIFACAIYSQVNEGTLIDWRVDPFSCEHRIIEPPPEVAAKCFELTSRSALQFAAMDFIVTRSGEWVFLESNPNGQWLWIEQMTGAPLARAVADLLLASGGRRG